MPADELFEAVLIHREVPEDPRIPLLIWWAARFAELGFMPSYGPGDHGNLSCRTPSGLLITARATSKARLHADHIVEALGVEQDDSIQLRIRCRGLFLPSTDTLLHWQIYQAHPGIQAILHGHDENALAKARELNLPMTTRSAMKPSRDLLEEVCRLAQSHAYVLLRDHGFLALGRSIDEAGELARLVCRNARSL